MAGSCIYSQLTYCSNFSITSIYQDTIDSTSYQVSINFNADANDIVGYPYISDVLNCNGDTVAMGSLFYFAQLGQTTQDYPITIIDSSDWCEPLTAIFNFGSGNLSEDITCSLSFQSSSITNVLNNVGIKIFPNPAMEILNVSVSNQLIGKSYHIVNQFGQIVNKGKIEWENEKIEIQHFASGFYMINFSDEFSHSCLFFKK